MVSTCSMVTSPSLASGPRIACLTKSLWLGLQDGSSSSSPVSERGGGYMSWDLTRSLWLGLQGGSSSSSSVSAGSSGFHSYSLSLALMVHAHIYSSSMLGPDRV